MKRTGTVVEFVSDFEDENEFPSQVYIAIGARTNSDVIAELEEIIRIIKNNGKPQQGIVVGGRVTRQVITPIWDGKEY